MHFFFYLFYWIISYVDLRYFTVHDWWFHHLGHPSLSLILSSIFESYTIVLYLLKIGWGGSCFFMSLIVLEWIIRVLCGKTVETEVNNTHSWKWVALLFSVLVWVYIRAEGGLSLLLPWLSSVHQRLHIPVPCPGVRKVLLSVHASLSSFDVPACWFHKSGPFPCSHLFLSTTLLLLGTWY